MFPRRDVDLATACQNFIVNKNRFSNDGNRLGEDRERYHRERDTSVAKNATTEA